ncbi:8220_t:CDS:2, partial [Funneliformis geosporum]
GFETQNLNESIENSMEIDKKVKLNETLQVMSEVNKENVRTSARDIIIYKAYQYISDSDLFDLFQKLQSQAELSECLAIQFL